MPIKVVMGSHTEKSVLSDRKKPIAKPTNGLETARLCATESLDKKAENVVILDVSKLTSFTDYFVICSAPSERQVQAIGKQVVSELKANGRTILGMEGLEEGSWALVDCGDVVFHCFLDSMRQYYNLEGFWSQAVRVPLEENAAQLASAHC